MNRIRFIKDTYEQLKNKNQIFFIGCFIIVTNLPWYKSWFRLKPTRMKFGDGKTPFNKLKFM